MASAFKIADREVGGDAPCYVIAELSCNHEGSFDEALRILQAAADAGADAIKLQTYTADSLTRDFGTRPTGTMWEKTDLYRLYEKAHTPREWHEKLQKAAADHGLHFFSSPFDEEAVDYLDEIGVPVFKIASFEVVDVKLLQKVAQKGKPVIISNGMTDYLELAEAVRVLRDNGVRDLAVLHCNSGYPAAFKEANLKTISAIGRLFGVVPGLSDHTLFADDSSCTQPMAHITPAEAVGFGSKIVEVHLTMDRAHARRMHESGEGGFDWAFSRNPDELKKMIEHIRLAERGLSRDLSEEEQRVASLTHGEVKFEPTEKELSSRTLRPTLWVVESVKAGQPLRFAGGRSGNVDSIRPGGGLPIRFADFVDGKEAACDLPAGTPLQWSHVRLS